MDGLQDQKVAAFRLTRIFPWFIVWFLVASLLNTLGVFPESTLPHIHTIGKFMVVMALTAVGLSADFKKMLRTGLRPMLLGLIVWIVVAVVSLVVQAATGSL